jgi:hypothetical protein
VSVCRCFGRAYNDAPFAAQAVFAPCAGAREWLMTESKCRESGAAVPVLKGGPHTQCPSALRAFLRNLFRLAIKTAPQWHINQNHWLDRLVNDQISMKIRVNPVALPFCICASVPRLIQPALPDGPV